MITLNVNIDHVATLRQARGGNDPDPIAAASIAELSGAMGIVCHLREDRRHINDRDARILREVIQTKMDLEMAANEEIIKIALELKPEMVTLVPEKRQELTTEGGLDLVANQKKYSDLSERMHEKNIEVSFFIEPDKDQIKAALNARADMVELHTGIYANAKNKRDRDKEFVKLQTAAEYAHNMGLAVAAGHGLNYQNTYQICQIHQIRELSIGHSIMCRAILVGLSQAVREMIELINKSEMFRQTKSKI